MTVRPPQSLSPQGSADSGLNLLEYELMAERADSLGRHGLKVEKTLALLNDQLAKGVSGDARENLLNDAVWAFFIQREICGLRSNRDAIQRYGIPREVIARLGIVRKR